MSIEPPPDWYLRRCQFMIAQGKEPALLTMSNSEPEPANVFSIEAARTRRCIEILRTRGRL
jgi:hypothetical protein